MRSSMRCSTHRVGSILLVVALLNGLLLAFALTAVAAPRTLGDPGNENGMVYDTGPNSTIRAMTFDSAGNLYVGGDFVTATVTANRVAKFDGSTWTGFGNGLSNNRVYALAVTGTTVYAGGTFNLSGSTPVTGTAKWNGAEWVPLCNGTDCGLGGGSLAAYALALDNAGNLYVGGDFTTAGGVAANRVAQWSPTANGGVGAWSALGSGFDNGVVNSLLISGTALYAGGTFTQTGGVGTTRVAKWDGVSWTAVGANGPNGTVSALAKDSVGDLYASGSFATLADTTTVSGTAKWNGSTWSAMCNGGTCGVTPGTTARSLAADSANNVYTCGSFLQAGGVTVNYIAKWNGTAWSALGSGFGNNNACNVVAFRNGYLFTGGGSLVTGAWGITGLASSQRLGRWTAAEGRAVSGSGSYTFYPANALVTATLPVTVNVTTQGDLARINIQRYDKNHPNAITETQTGYYWQIEGLNNSGAAATGYTANLTLPANGFTPDFADGVCYYTGTDWNCASSSRNAVSITRNGVTAFSDWAVGNFITFYQNLPVIRR